MKKDDLSQSSETKIIIKRRFTNDKKEYLVSDSNTKLCEWKQYTGSQAETYDETHKDVLPYFPALFEDSNSRVKIYYKNKYLQIEYNGKPVTMESSLSKKARVQILTELNKIMPVQIFEAMYHQGKEIKKARNMAREIDEEEESNQIEQEN